MLLSSVELLGLVGSSEKKKQLLESLESLRSYGDNGNLQINITISIILTKLVIHGIKEYNEELLSNIDTLAKYLEQILQAKSQIIQKFPEFLRILREDLVTLRKTYSLLDLIGGNQINEEEIKNIPVEFYDKLELVLFQSVDILSSSISYKCIEDENSFRFGSNITECLLQNEALKACSKIHFQKVKQLVPNDNTHKYLNYVRFIIKESFEIKNEGAEISNEIEKCLILQTRLLSGLYYNFAAILLKIPDYPSAIMALSESLLILQIGAKNLSTTFPNHELTKDELQNIKSKLQSYKKILETCTIKIQKMFIPLQQQIQRVLKSTGNLPDSFIEKWMEIKQQHPRLIGLKALPLTLIPFFENEKEISISPEIICTILKKQYNFEKSISLMEIPTIGYCPLERHNIKLMREQSYQAQNIITEYLLEKIFPLQSNSNSFEFELQRGLSYMEKAILVRLDDNYSLSTSINDEIYSITQKDELNQDEKNKQKEIKHIALKAIQESVQILLKLQSLSIKNKKNVNSNEISMQLSKSYIWLGIIYLEVGGYKRDPFENAFKLCKSIIHSIQIIPNQILNEENENDEENENNFNHDCKLFEKQFKILSFNQKLLNLEELFTILQFLSNSFRFINEEIFYLQCEYLLIELIQRMYIIPYYKTTRDYFRNNSDTQCKCSSTLFHFFKEFMDEGITRCGICYSNIGCIYNDLGYSKKSNKFLQKAQFFMRGKIIQMTNSSDTETEELILLSDNDDDDDDDSLEIDLSDELEVELTEENTEEIHDESNDHILDEIIIEEEHFIFLARAQYYLQLSEYKKAETSLYHVHSILSQMNSSSFKQFQLGEFKYTLAQLMLQNNNSQLSKILQISLESLENKKESLLMQTGFLVTPNHSQASYLPLIEYPHLLWRYILSIIKSYEQVGEFYDLNGQPDQSLKYYILGRNTGRLFHLGHVTSRFLLHLGELYYKQNQWEKADSSYQQILSHLQKTQIDDDYNDDKEDENENSNEKNQIRSALSSVSIEYRRFLEILVFIRCGDLLFKQQQELKQSKSSHNEILCSISKKDELKIKTFYKKAKNLILIIQSSKYYNKINRLLSMALKKHNNNQQTPEKSLFKILTNSPYVTPKLNSSSCSSNGFCEFWSSTLARIDGKIARIDVAQGNVLKAMKRWKESIKILKNQNSLLCASFACSLAQCHLLYNSNTENQIKTTSTSNITRTKLIRSQTAPNKIQMQTQQEEKTKKSSKEIEIAKKYLYSAYELVRNSSPVKLKQKILQTLLLCFNYNEITMNDSYIISHIINSSLFISIHNKISSSSILYKENDLLLKFQSLSLNNQENRLINHQSFSSSPSLIDIQVICNDFDKQFENIPSTWNICNISLSLDKKFLILTRLRKNQKPICIHIPFSFDFINEMKSIMNDNHNSMKSHQSKDDWWETRKKLDFRLAQFLFTIQNEILSHWKCLLRGIPKFSSLEQTKQFEKCIKRVTSKIYKKKSTSSLLNEEIIRLYMESFHFLSTNERSSFFSCKFKGEAACQAELQKIYLKEQKSFVPSGFHPSILIIDDELQFIPWESMPILYSLPISRVPSFIVLQKLLSLPKYQNNLNSSSSYSFSNCFYMLNPNGDEKLTSTQDRFTDTFAKQKYWNGIIGKCEKQQNELLETLQSTDLYVYCGHGSSERFIDRSIIEMASSLPVSLLMGCSSCKLKSSGDNYDPNGFILSLLLGGSPCAVGYLWDVTDRDCDIVCASILKEIVKQNDFCNDLLNSSSKNVKRYRSILKKLNLPQETPFISSSNTLNEYVARAKKFCFLPFLNGAALVSYGLPISC